MRKEIEKLSEEFGELAGRIAYLEHEQHLIVKKINDLKPTNREIEELEEDIQDELKLYYG